MGQRIHKPKRNRHTLETLACNIASGDQRRRFVSVSSTALNIAAPIFTSSIRTQTRQSFIAKGVKQPNKKENRLSSKQDDCSYSVRRERYIKSFTQYSDSAIIYNIYAKLRALGPLSLVFKAKAATTSSSRVVH